MTNRLEVLFESVFGFLILFIAVVVISCVNTGYWSSPLLKSAIRSCDVDRTGECWSDTMAFVKWARVRGYDCGYCLTISNDGISRGHCVAWIIDEASRYRYIDSSDTLGYYERTDLRDRDPIDLANEEIARIIKERKKDEDAEKR